MNAVLAAATVALMAGLAFRAERRFADHPTLPMQFGLDGRPTWRAARRLALAFLPLLALAVLLLLLILAPDTLGTAIAALSLLAGQVFYHFLLSRAV